MSEWKTYKLGELGTLARGKSKHRPRDAAFLYGGKYPFIQTGDIKAANHKISKHSQTYSEEGLKQSKLWDKGTICITIAANIADTAILEYPACFPDSVIGFLPNEKVCNLDFMEYQLQFAKRNLQSHSIGSVQDNINLGTFQNFTVTIPDLPTQTQIAQILTSIDDKIELNLQMNQTLEAMAQALFKEWFVDFNFPGFDGELVDGLPKGWRKEPIDENIEFLNGLALQKFPPLNENDFLPVIKIRELKQGFTNASDKASTKLPEKYVIYDGDILFSWSGSLEVVLWCEGKGALNQHLFKVSSNIYPKWFYFFWVREYLPLYKSIAEGKATTMGHIQRRHLTDTIINVPNKELLNVADSILSPILDKIQENKIQIQTLTQTRDTLLPRLMSGKLELV